MWEFLCFWGRCIARSWNFAYGVFGPIETAIGLLAIGLLWHTKLKKKLPDEWESKVMRWAFAIFALAFGVSVVFVSPFLEKEEEKALRMEDQAKATNTSAPQMTVHVDGATDSVARDDLKESKKKISALQAQVDEARSQQKTTEENLRQADERIREMAAKSPLDEPLVSAKAIVTIDAPPEPGKTYTDGSFNTGLGASAVFVRRTAIFEQKTEFPLVVFTITHRISVIEPGLIRYRFICDQLSELSTFINRPIRELSEITALQVEVPKKLIAANRKSQGGEVVWVLNDRVYLKFPIPVQSWEEVGAVNIMRAQNVNEGIAPLAHP